MGSTEQTKTGNLIIEGVLRLGQFTTANAPAGTEGALYFDTTENKTKIYSSAAWGDLGGGEAGLLPQYTTTQRDALSPTVGQQIYNTTENTVQVYGSEDWKTVAAKAFFIPLRFVQTPDAYICTVLSVVLNTIRPSAKDRAFLCVVV